MTKHAIVHFDADGNVSFRHSDDVVMLVIDERCPGDRVYCCDSPITESEVKAIVGSDKIGHAHDSSDAAKRLAVMIRGRG